MENKTTEQKRTSVKKNTAHYSGTNNRSCACRTTARALAHRAREHLHTHLELSQRVEELVLLLGQPSRKGVEGHELVDLGHDMRARVHVRNGGRSERERTVGFISAPISRYLEYMVFFSFSGERRHTLI